MRTRQWLYVCAILVVGGCVPSLHSIVTEKTLIYDPSLPGSYQTEDTCWTITGDPNDKSYSIVIKEKEDKQSLLTAQLVEIQGHRFLDFYPSDEAELNTGDWFNAHILAVHVFWKLDKTEQGFSIFCMNPDTIKEVLEAKPQLVKHEVVEEDRVVLTDTPENLQKFLLAGLTIEKFYGDAVELKPVKN
jgi:hypothetical protein